MNEDNQLFPAYTTTSTRKSRLFVVFVVILLAVGVILAGLFLLGASTRSPERTAVVPTLAVTATPLPTSSASAVLQGGLIPTVSPTGELSSVDKATKLNRSELDIAVLNGSGIAGAAKGVSDYLQGLGYRVVRVENADAFTYTNINVIVKKSVSRYADLLRKDLRGKPEFSSVSASVSDEIANEAVVIVGQ
jgi:hypothetical protein